ncbi:MAG: restriction endonuclease subunit S [Candidatus Roizmanbacteria bacterium]|nr:restriction endonuclease subunit S [Candidatus Roizmanbacteria bacterium]
MVVNFSPKTTSRLRFPEFSGVWEEKKLGEIATFLKGKGISKEDISINGKNKCIRYGELYTQYNEIITEVKSKTNFSSSGALASEENDVLIPSSGETSLDIATTCCVKEAGVLLGGDLNVIRLNKYQSGDFFSYYLSNGINLRIAKLAQGNSVVHLYASHLKTLKIKSPSLDEQQKIASLFIAVDGWISNLKAQEKSLERYKKGMMQKIFSQQTRFKDDNGKDFSKWEEKKLGEIVTFLKGKGISKEDISINGKNKCIRYGELYTEYNEQIKEVVSRTDVDLNTSKLSKANDILMPTSDVTPSGLATASALNESGIILGGDILIIRSKFINNIFFCYWIKANKKEVMRLVNGVTVYHLYGSDMSRLEIKLPKPEEQQKIADFLTSLDDLIKSKLIKISQAEKWKKGLMQMMFV